MVPQVPGAEIGVKVHNRGGELGSTGSTSLKWGGFLVRREPDARAEIGQQVPISGVERSVPGFQVGGGDKVSFMWELGFPRLLGWK